MTPLLPWHGSAWQRVSDWRRQARIPHAILIAGPAGLGKEQLAQALLERLLCEDRGQEPLACGRCRACHLLAAGTHPDVRTIAPEEAGKGIRIEEIRALAEWSTLRSARGTAKVALLVPAEAMNRSAANALLKTLEEPPAGTVMLLVSHAARLLPATIRSRCQRLDLRIPKAEEVLPWLAASLRPGMDPRHLLERAAGAPLRARTLAETEASDVDSEVTRSLHALLHGTLDPVQAAEQWGRVGATEVSQVLFRLTAQILRARANGLEAQRKLAADLGSVAGRVDPRLCFGLLDQCLAVIRHGEMKANLNVQLLLEELATIAAACASRP